MDIKNLEAQSDESLNDTRQSFEKDRTDYSETVAHIRDVISNVPERTLKATRSIKWGMEIVLLFQVFSTRTIDDPNGKRHVAYTLLVRNYGHIADPYPGVIERRYTDFLTLYLCLRQAFPSALAAFNFPRKLLTGNFSESSIESRIEGFQDFFALIATDHSILSSPQVTAFVQNKELLEAKKWIESQRFDQAIPLLENILKMLNKIHTDRHPVVLRALCLLVACCYADNHSKAVQFADLALHRYESVSDFDLLRYYVPLLKLCISLFSKTGKEESAHLEERLANMKLKGMKVDGCPDLLEAIMPDLFNS